MVKRTNKLYKLTERIRGNKAVKAGVLSDATYPNGDKVAKIAFWNEYGTKTAPPRPFFRNAISEGKSSWRAILQQSLKATNFDIERALGMLGEEMSGDIRESIIKGGFEPNSPVTLLLKSRFPMKPEDITLEDFLQAIEDVEKGEVGSGSNNKPLNWTGTLIKSIKYEVENES